MAWGTLTDARALIGAPIDFERRGVGLVVGVIDDGGRCEVAA
jgi:hypothetical protein